MQCPPNERTYHIYYFLLNASADLKNSLKLGGPADYHYTNQAETLVVDGIDFPISERNPILIRGTLASSVVSDDGKSFVVETEAGKQTVKMSKCYDVNPASQDGVDDNTSLMFLNEAGLLHNLKYRYEHDLIYTYTGNILIAVNPFARLDIYGEEKMFEYVGKSIGVLPPHIFAIADQALRNMKGQKKGQSIIVSGESGAGKTETAKVALKYLTTMCSNDSAASAADEPLEQRLLKSNPILEAFGNSKTVRYASAPYLGNHAEILLSDAG